MNVIAYLLQALAQILHLLINMYTMVIGISVLLSWVNPDPYNPIVRFLRQITEPVFQKVRRLLPKSLFSGNIDFTPMIVLFVLIVLDNVLVNLVLDLARKLLQ